MECRERDVVDLGFTCDVRPVQIDQQASLEYIGGLAQSLCPKV
jgi:hypothetical protein